MQTSDLNISAIILAAGKGTRMKSDIPKVLHHICYKPILQWVIDALKKASIKNICVVIGGNIPQFQTIIKQNNDLVFCEQKNQLGTADAVASAAFGFENVTIPYYAKGQLLHGKKICSDYVIICTGDTPNLKSQTIFQFYEHCIKNNFDLGLIVMDHPNPFGYGRIILDDNNHIVKIIEQKDLPPTLSNVSLCNSGIIFSKTTVIFNLLQEITPNNAQKEYYLTDVFEIAYKKNLKSYPFITSEYQEFEGVNTPEQLKNLQKLMLAEQKQHCE